MMTGLKLILMFYFYFQASKSLKDPQIVICFLGSVFCSGVLVGMSSKLETEVQSWNHMTSGCDVQQNPQQPAGPFRFVYL